ncbi:fimbrial protein [Serratia quinivorans]|uniref:fimbrial protein n=1 Tax=Serratia quinivorans TaxID=137545 RepID=UPI00217BF825|nr:hypothetical protein [Serratia quinivorans]CAI1967162.1 fimbrial protein [Serratia quinivorans]CAI2161013.1 fimbrial protein [Serratia quinivorans]
MMNFNKAMAVSILMVGITSMSVYAADNDAGSVHVTGSFVDASCLIGQTQLDRTLSFDPVTKAAATAAAQDAVLATQQLTFNMTACPTATQQVGIKFDFNQVGTGGNYITNTSDEPGSGALFGISKDTDDAALATGTAVYAAAINEGAATVNAKVNIYRTADQFAVGNLASTANVTLVYN